MININIKPKTISQGYKKADVIAEILQIHYIAPVKIDEEALVHVSLCTANKDANGNTSVGIEVYSEQLVYRNPDYSNWVQDADLIQFICKELEIELL